MDKFKEFVALVREMRSAQKEYFTTRKLCYLQKSKSLERRVDVEIENVFLCQCSAKAVQLELQFEDNLEKAVQ